MLAAELDLKDELVEALIAWGCQMTSTSDVPQRSAGAAATRIHQALHRWAQAHADALRREFDCGAP